LSESSDHSSVVYLRLQLDLCLDAVKENDVLVGFFDTCA
jgi:hypothetical protein